MTRFVDSLTAAPLSAPRRIVLRAFAATGFGLVSLAGTGPHAAAKKKKGKKKKKKCKKGGPVTCADVCPAVGGYAFHLIGGGDVCATGADPIGCAECDEDSDCYPLTGMYFCVKDQTNLATGEVSDFSLLCGAYPRGICVTFQPCALGS